MMLCPYRKKTTTHEYYGDQTVTEEFMPCYEKECPHYVDKEYCQRADAEASGRFVTK